MALEGALRVRVGVGEDGEAASCVADLGLAGAASAAPRAAMARAASLTRRRQPLGDGQRHVGLLLWQHEHVGCARRETEAVVAAKAA